MHWNEGELVGKHGDSSRHLDIRTPDEARRLARIMNGFFPTLTSQPGTKKRRPLISKSDSLRDRDVRLCKDSAILDEANETNRSVCEFNTRDP